MEHIGFLLSYFKINTTDFISIGVANFGEYVGYLIVKLVFTCVPIYILLVLWRKFKHRKDKRK